jgi:hypothetical protein
MQRVGRAVGQTSPTKGSPRSRRPATRRQGEACHATVPVMVPKRARGPATLPSAFRVSQAAPCISSIDKRHDAGQQRERVQQADELGVERALVDRVKIIGQVKRHALQHVADRHAEDQRGHAPPANKRPVPGRPPAGVIPLRAVLEGHRPDDEGGQYHEHRQVEAGERDRVERRPGGEDRAAAEDEPDLVAFPDRAHGVDRHAAFDIGLRPTKGSSAPTPMSKPSVSAKPISSTPSRPHQMTRRMS